jgi:hypothetical protein
VSEGQVHKVRKEHKVSSDFLVTEGLKEFKVFKVTSVLKELKVIQEAVLKAFKET